MIELTDVNFKDMTSKGVCVVDFWATWCGPCKMYGPIFEGVAKSFEDDNDVELYKADVDNTQLTAGGMGVTAVPSTVFIKDGEVVKTVSGVQMANDLIEAINTLKDM